MPARGPQRVHRGILCPGLAPALATIVLLAALGWIGLRVVDFVTAAAGAHPSAVTAPNVAALVLAIAAIVVLIVASRRRRKRAWY